MNAEPNENGFSRTQCILYRNVRVRRKKLGLPLYQKDNKVLCFVGKTYANTNLKLTF
jgi:hypothetical protein